MKRPNIGILRRLYNSSDVVVTARYTYELFREPFISDYDLIVRRCLCDSSLDQFLISHSDLFRLGVVPPF